ncbi:zinc metalloprotease HtpX [Halovenus salina]|uniref:Protease HtpX homolog n=1 Tax=Halovenus salina TaxID=1510225 RepID=A0ABD5W0F3_9EURY|nr:zinc metalloprotease HtpX [Halovenus salina]
MKLQADWGLRGRMVLVSLLLLVAYLALAVVLVEVLGGGLLFTVAILGGLSFAQYYYSGSLALRSMGAREVSAEEYPELHRMVTQLAQQTDTPQPTVAVAETAVPNAFAAGRSPSAATICVTTGLLDRLDQDELEGVLAHELAHIKNRDVAVMTIASFFASIAFLVVRWGWLLGGGRDRDAAPIWVAILVSLVVWVISFFLIRALSRYREYAADRGAAQMTGEPAALASALRSISEDMEQVPKEDLREQAEMNAFFILPIRSGFIGRLARTHPSTERRIDQLLELQGEL